jgi:hypothetical protein
MNASLNYIQALELIVTNCQNDKCIAFDLAYNESSPHSRGANSENFSNRKGGINWPDLIDNFLAKYSNLSKIFLW